jgi:hypothetical protein
MRSLTESEAKVIAVMLASADGHEKERLRQLGLPRSTYHAARRRAYAEGWLRDRYVPDPAAFGFPVVKFVLARPFADRAAELPPRWDQTPGNVLTWSGSQLALGVFYQRNVAAAPKPEKSLADAGAGWSCSVAARSDQPSMPVFFDFEGLWVHLGELSGSRGYPHGLGGAAAPPDEPAAPIGRAETNWAAGHLIRRPFVAAEQGRAGHLVGPFGLPWSQQKLLRAGTIRHRVFLDPATIPPYKGRLGDQVTFITGEFREGVRPDVLFATLTRECRVFPFLYVYDHTRLLIGALGRGGAATGDTSLSAGRRPVMPTLTDSLKEIELIQELVARVRVVADHRYDRLVASREVA